MRNFLRVLSVILLISWMGLIFFFSSQTADTSSQTSGQVIEIIAEKVYPDFNQMTETEREELVSSLQFKVRKSAHIGKIARQKSRQPLKISIQRRCAACYNLG